MTQLFCSFIDIGFSFVSIFIPDTSKFDLAFDGLSGFINSIIDFLQQVNFIVPLDTIASIISIEVGIQVVMFSAFFTDKVRRVVTSFIP